MKRRMKKLLCLALSGMLCASSFSTAVWAEESAPVYAEESMESLTDAGEADSQGADITEAEEELSDQAPDAADRENEDTAPEIQESGEQEEETDLEETVIEEEQELAGETAATTLGLNVQKHTKEEIQAFFNTHPALVTDPDTYDVMPSFSEPYAPGRLSSITVERAFNMINQMRYIAGINANLENNDYYEQLVNAGTFINALNGVMTHYPARPEVLADPVYDELYEMGATGCSSSNIAYGYDSINSAIVQGWMYDGNASNIDRVGHRRWILNPYMKYTAFGRAGSQTAMYAFNRNNPGGESRVAWPAQVTPVQYFTSSYPWSVSMGSSVNISTTSVSLTRKYDGKTWNFSSDASDGVFYVDNGGYGQTGCIIFRPNGLGTLYAGDEFEVEISLNNGETIVAYPVEFFSLDTSTAPKLIGTCRIRMSSSVKGYGGSSLSPELVISDQGTELQENADYTISYNRDDSGFVREAVIKGLNQYTGQVSLLFTKLNYELNGGTEERANPFALVKGDSFYLNSPVRDGYTFEGWYDNASFTGSSMSYVSGNGQSEITFYAKWKEINHYTIQYDLNGGTGGPVTGTGDGIPVVSRDTPSRAGYEFEGWSTDPSAEHADYLPGARLPEEKSFYLYAVWSQAPEITMDSNIVTMDTNIVFGGQHRFFRITPDCDSRFILESSGDWDTYAWLNNESGIEITHNDDGGENANFRITADLKAGQTYYLEVKMYSSLNTGSFQVHFRRPASIIYHGNGGEEVTDRVSAAEFDEGIAVAEDLPSKTVKVTYNANGGTCEPKSVSKQVKFTGWNTKADGSGNSYAAGEIYSGTEDLHLYAILSVPTMGTLPTPSYGARDFLGWYTSLTGSTKVTEKTKVTKNMTIYARWSKLLEILEQPESVQAGIGDKVSFRVNAADAKTYKWQYSKDKKTWSSSSLSSAATNTLSLTVSETNAGNFYRCKVTGEDGKILYTDAVTLGLLPGAVIKSQPVSVAANIGDSVRYTVKADNVKAAGFQWYYSKDGSTWSKSSISSATTDTLTVKASASNKDNIYRCTITGLDGRKIKSAKAGMVIVSAQPRDAEVAVGKTAAFSVTADGIASYQWYYSKDEVNWSKSTLSSAVAARLSFKVSETNKNNYYRCKLTAQNGISVYTNTVRVLESSVIRITAQPVSVAAVNGAKVSFSVKASGVASWQWQYSKDGSSWKNSTISSASSAELKLTVSDSNRANRYRCKLTGTDGSVRYTDVVSVK